MWTKRATLVLLVGINAALLGVLLLSLSWLPKAYGQAAGRSGTFATVTANVPGQSYDVLYLLDISDHKLHAFYPPNVSTRELSYAGFRDLKADFGQP